ncbi:WD40 repeat-like protein [Suillus brevipes Sb2]|nr:WD40 repeat-like protein [Suillus brevipes Sb2]
MFSKTKKTPAITPQHTMPGHTRWVNGVVHLPGGRQIMTCSTDGSLRLWDLENGKQIGKWRDETTGVWSIALSPDGKTVASGGNNGNVRLWDIETRTTIARWAGHTHVVGALCWSVDGKKVLSGSWDGTARVRNVKSGKTVLTIRTGHQWVNAVIYSPDAKKIATGGCAEDAIKIWDAKTDKLLKKLKQDDAVWSLAWTSDGKKLICGSLQIRIFNTATWEEITILEPGHRHFVYAITLSQNERLLASASLDNTARLWNLDTNLPVGPPLQHENNVRCAALSADGKLLVTGCQNRNVYTWAIQPILKKAGLDDQLTDGINIEASQVESKRERTARSSLSDKSFLRADATRCHNEFGDVDELSPRFFDGMDSSLTGDVNSHASASALLAHLSSLFHRFRSNNVDATELPQPSTPSVSHLRVHLARLSSLVRRSPPENAPNELQQPSTPSPLSPRALFARLSSLLYRPRLNADEETEHQPTTPSGLHPAALIDRLSSLFRFQVHTNEEIELSQYPRHPRVVEVNAVRDREVIFTAPPPPQKAQQTQSHDQGSSTTQHAPGTNPNTPHPRHPHPLPVRLLAHLVLFLCCAPQKAAGNTQSTQQQQGRPQGQVYAQVSSSQTQHAAPSTSPTPTAPDTLSNAPVAASA